MLERQTDPRSPATLAIPSPLTAVLAVVGALGITGAPPVAAQSVDTLAASAALAAFDANCHTLGEALWGGSLCGPVVLVHAPTRAALANHSDPGGTFLPVAGLYAGTLPVGMPTANTAVEWSGERWTMVLLPLPADARARHALIAHEAFHRAQPALGLEARDPVSTHLDEEQGRVWLRLELRALARALEATGEDATRAALDAFLFRAHRHRLYPGADTLEAALEHHEGLAEYTGVRYAAMLLGDDVVWTARATHAFEDRPSYVRSFAYATGPAIGLLLDRLDPAWRSRIRTTALATLFAHALAGAPVPAPGEGDVLAHAAAYDYAAVAAEEADRMARLAARLGDIRRRLIDGPTLILRQTRLSASFDPNALVPVPGAGTYYPTGSFQAPWGRLEVRAGGALLSDDWGALQLPADLVQIEGAVIQGDGWTLELDEGWAVRPRADSTGWEAMR